MSEERLKMGTKADAEVVRKGEVVPPPEPPKKMDIITELTSGNFQLVGKHLVKLAKGRDTFMNIGDNIILGFRFMRAYKQGTSLQVIAHVRKKEEKDGGKQDNKTRGSSSPVEASGDSEGPAAADEPGPRAS